MSESYFIVFSLTAWEILSYFILKKTQCICFFVYRFFSEINDQKTLNKNLLIAFYINNKTAFSNGAITHTWYISFLLWGK